MFSISSALDIHWTDCDFWFKLFDHKVIDEVDYFLYGLRAVNQGNDYWSFQVLNEQVLSLGIRYLFEGKSADELVAANLAHLLLPIVVEQLKLSSIIPDPCRD